MPLSDLDEFTGRTTDGVSRGARFLDALDAIGDMISSGDRDRERDGFEHARSIWSDMTEKERREVAYLMSAKFMELNEAYIRSASRNRDDLRDLVHFCGPLAGGQKAPVETQATISAWAESTFGPSGSNARAIARANREMAELLEHVTADDRHPEAAEEIADIVIVLSRVMTRLGVDLQDEIDRKMAKNRARKWKLDGTGHGYHVKEDAATSKPCLGCGNVGTRTVRGREYCKTCGQAVL
jgi:MazG-like family